MFNWKTFAACVFAAAPLAQAHLTASSLVPKGGESLKVGDVVTITWGVEEAHEKGIDIALSKNNGTTWTNIKAAYADAASGTDTFKWTVPADAVSAQAKLRICQQGPCSDAQNTNNASGNAPWRLVSGTFAIAGSTALAGPAASTEGLTVDYRPASRSVEVTFAMVHEGEVSLQAIDMQGRVVAPLLQGRFAAGEHRLSVFANRLEGAQSLVFKLQAGDRSLTHAWMSIR